jgi:hypothetical protein
MKFKRGDVVICVNWNRVALNPVAFLDGQAYTVAIPPEQNRGYVGVVADSTGIPNGLTADHFINLGPIYSLTKVQKIIYGLI